MYRKIGDLTNGKSNSPYPKDGIPRQGLPVPGMVCPFCGKGIVSWESSSGNLPGVGAWDARYLCFACLTVFTGSYPKGSRESRRKRVSNAVNLWKNP